MCAQLSMHAIKRALYGISSMYVHHLCHLLSCLLHLLRFAAVCPYAMCPYAYILSCCCPLCISTLSMPSMCSMFWSGMAFKLRNIMVQGHHRGESEGALYPPYAQPPPPPPILQHQRPSMQWHAGVQFVVVLWPFVCCWSCSLSDEACCFSNVV